MTDSIRYGASHARKKLRIAVSRQGTFAVDGQAHYETLFLNALSEIAPQLPEELFCAAEGRNTLSPLLHAGGLTYRGLRVEALGELPLTQEPPEAYLQHVFKAPTVDPDGFYPDLNRARAYRSSNVDLVIELTPHLRPFDTLLPFVAPIFDLNHRLQPEFPEVAANGEAAWRDYLFNNICRYATLVIVDSELGKEHVLRFYGQHIREDRIRVLPYYPPIRDASCPSEQDLARVAAKYHLPKRFLFYPAQFWPHKNHQLILIALGLVASQTKEKIPVVFCGSYSGATRAQNFIELRTLAQRLGLQDRVHYLGQVPDDDIGALYASAAALVMPTFFGPTILPPMEAWHYGCPVITSAIAGIREQIGDAGLLVDPKSPQDMAQAILRVWRERALCSSLVEKGKLRLEQYGWSDFVSGVQRIVADACAMVRSGHSPRYPKIELGR